MEQLEERRGCPFQTHLMKRMTPLAAQANATRLNKAGSSDRHPFARSGACRQTRGTGSLPTPRPRDTEAIPAKETEEDLKQIIGIDWELWGTQLRP